MDLTPSGPLSRPTQPWHLVKHWLHDLATEIDAAARDGSLPALRLDRVWIARDGRARLLDFTVPGGDAPTPRGEPGSIVSTQIFLELVARRALHLSEAEAAGRPFHQLPLSATALLRTLGGHAFATTDSIVATLRPLLGSTDRLTRGRRAASLLLCAAAPAVPVLMIAGVALLGWSVMAPDIEELRSSLSYLSKLPQGAEGETAAEREALEVYIADRFGAMLSDPAFWEDPFKSASVRPLRAVAQRVMAEHGAVSPDQLAQAKPALARVQRARELKARNDEARPVAAIAMMVVVVSTMPFVLGALVVAPLLRGGLLLSIFRIAVVTRCGAQVSRGRALLRALIAWSPALILVPVTFPKFFPAPASYVRESPLLSWTFLTAAAGLFLVGALWGIRHPGRGVRFLT